MGETGLLTPNEIYELSDIDLMEGKKRQKSPRDSPKILEKIVVSPVWVVYGVGYGVNEVIQQGKRAFYKLTNQEFERVNDKKTLYPKYRETP